MNAKKISDARKDLLIKLFSEDFACELERMFADVPVNAAWNDGYDTGWASALEEHGGDKAHRVAHTGDCPFCKRGMLTVWTPGHYYRCNQCHEAGDIVAAFAKLGGVVFKHRKNER